jgi:hypothetical protein
MSFSFCLPSYYCSTTALLFIHKELKASYTSSLRPHTLVQLLLTILLLLYYCFTLLYLDIDTHTASMLYYCFTTALLIYIHTHRIYAVLARGCSSFTAALLQLYCCFTAALLLQYTGIYAVLARSCSCFTAALLLLYCCFTAALLLLYTGIYAVLARGSSSIGSYCRAIPREHRCLRL